MWQFISPTIDIWIGLLSPTPKMPISLQWWQKEPWGSSAHLTNFLTSQVRSQEVNSTQWIRLSWSLILCPGPCFLQSPCPCFLKALSYTRASRCFAFTEVNDSICKFWRSGSFSRTVSYRKISLVLEIPEVWNTAEKINLSRYIWWTKIWGK